jgi:hypothetical protein
MKGFWGFMKGSLAIQIKAMPRLFASPVVGAVRGAFTKIWEEMDKCDAEIAAFQARYMKEREEEIARMSGKSTAAG